MMSHRYGRYGPHAWKYLRRRKYAHRPAVLPVPVISTTLFVRVVVPSTTERVVIVIMPENELPDEAPTPDITIIRGPGGEELSALPANEIARGKQAAIPSGDAALVNHAQWRAHHDAETVKELIKDGHFVRIDDARLEKRLKDLVLAYFDRRVADGASHPDIQQEYQAKREVYRDAYLQYFHTLLLQGQKGSTYLSLSSHPLEARLRCLAIEDRNRFAPVGANPLHRRDLAVIRVLSILNEDLDHTLQTDEDLDHALQTLDTIHEHASIYEDYYENPRKEVSWPGPASF
jgi:hypothetical protein